MAEGRVSKKVRERQEIGCQEKETQQDVLLDISNAMDRVSAKVAFISDSAPISAAHSLFTKEGLEGLGWVLSSITEDIDAARDALDSLFRPVEEV